MRAAALFLTGLACAEAFTALQSPYTSKRQISSSLNGANSNNEENVSNRRSFLIKSAASASLLLTNANPANAGIDPSALKALPVEGDTTGVQSRMRQIESVNGPRPEDSKDIAFEKLASGASYREYREGKGDATVGNGSKVAAEMTIRCQSFATANEPGGLKYFSTKADTEFNELAWTIGDGELPPELEECMMGMHKGGVRRIELPSTVVFAARKNNQLPQPTTKDGKRIFERLFKTDATLLFEVLVTRIK
mmetsp:Transcript_6727/g.10938  ORF Transcript_6727/g.10938 Transcript_6727/m.10938 type:complete len:251 (+) Transcript_6727:110-862(+)